MRWRRQPLAFSTLASLLLLAGCGLRPSPPDPLAVTLAPVAKARFNDVIETVSTLEAYELVQLAAQASGRIQQLPISQGDVVKQGQLLLVLDQAQLRAQLADLQAQAQKAKLTWQRYEFLVPHGAATAQQRDEFKAQYISAREAVIAQQADLAYSNLRSPLPGVVADVQVKIGDVLRAGDPFTKLIKNNTLLARVELPSTYAERIRVGLPVTLSLPGTNQPLAESLVSSVDPTVTPGNQALLVKAVFKNPQGALRNGQRLRTRLVLDSREQPAVPFAAVTQTSGQSFVWRVGSLKDLEAQPGRAPLEKLRRLPAGTRFALQTPVKLGSIQDNRYPVLSGVAAGQMVITSNLLKLRHGMPVQVVD